jgi:hypothetical protein
MGRKKLQLIILDQTGRHKDLKNCGWQFYLKTGALSFILVNASGTIWSIKFLSNSQHVIGSYFDKLLGVKTLCLRAKSYFEKLDGAYAAFLNEYQGSYKPSGDNVLSWKNHWGFFWIVVVAGQCKRIPVIMTSNILAFFFLQLLSMSSGCLLPSTF